MRHTRFDELMPSIETWKRFTRQACTVEQDVAYEDENGPPPGCRRVAKARSLEDHDDAARRLAVRLVRQSMRDQASGRVTERPQPRRAAVQVGERTTCVACGCELTAARNGQKWCSAACRKRAHEIAKRRGQRSVGNRAKR